MREEAQDGRGVGVVGDCWRASRWWWLLLAAGGLGAGTGAGTGAGVMVAAAASGAGPAAAVAAEATSIVIKEMNVRIVEWVCITC